MLEFIPYVVAAAFSGLVGRLLTKKAPGAKWIYLGLLFVALGVIGNVPQWWLRPVVVAASTVLIVWDYRRHRLERTK